MGKIQDLLKSCLLYGQVASAISQATLIPHGEIVRIHSFLLVFVCGEQADSLSGHTQVPSAIVDNR